MAVAFDSVTTGVGVTSLDPTGTVANDKLMVLCLVGYDASAGTFSGPANFTAGPAGRISIDNGIHDTCCQYFYKIAASESSGAYSFSFNGGACDAIMLIATGTDLTTPIGADSGTSHAADTSSYTLSWTAQTAPRAGMAITFSAGYDTDCPTPSGYTSRAFIDTVNRVCTKSVTASENVNPSATVPGSGASQNTIGAILIVLQEPTAAGAPSSAPTMTAGATGASLAAAAASSAPTLTGGATGASLAAAAASSAPTLTADATSVTGASDASSAPTMTAGATGASLKAGDSSSAPTMTADATSAALKQGAASSAPTMSADATSQPTGNVYFRDDFNGSSVDETTWTILNRISDQGSGQDNCYVTSQTTVSSGKLILTAEFHTQSCGDSENSPTSQAYRSGGVVQKLAPFRYGTITFRAKAPAPDGSWPAVWLLGYKYHASHSADPGTFNPTGQDWPNDGWGEIDIWEIGNPTDSGDIWQIIHQDAANTGGEVAVGFDPTADFHTYQLIWAPGSLIWKVDGTTTRTITSGDVSSNPMFLIANYQVGGSLGDPKVSGQFPGTMELEYIEVISDTMNASSAPTMTAGATSTSLAASAASSAPTMSANATGQILASDASSAPTLSAGATGAALWGTAGSSTLTMTVGATGASLAAAAASSAPTMNAAALGQFNDIPAGGAKWRPEYWQRGWIPDYFAGA